MEIYKRFTAILRGIENIHDQIETLAMDILNPAHCPPEATLQGQMFADQIFLMPPYPQEAHQSFPFDKQELQNLAACQIVFSERGCTAHREEVNESWQELLTNLDYSDI